MLTRRTAVFTALFQVIILIRNIASCSLTLHRRVPTVDELMTDHSEIAKHALQSSVVIHEDGGRGG